MKTQKEHSPGRYLQKGNNRWKWMAGATAATAVGVTAAQGSTITINLVGNYISGADGNHLNPDLTGDGKPDMMMTGAAHFLSYPHTSSGRIVTSLHKSSAAIVLNGIRARAYFTSYPLVSLRLGSQQTGASVGFLSLTGSIPITFTDLHINGGQPTEGFLEVTVSAAPAKVQLDSFTYNSIPDQGSSLALLAMGAGGILALRRWKAAQGPS